MSFKKLIICALISFNAVTIKSLSPLELEFHKQFFKAGDIVFDIGANGGYKTEIYLALGAHVIAVEPQPECCDKLRRSFGDRITIVQKGAADAEGVRELAICQSNPISTFSQEWRLQGRFKDSHIWDKMISVQMTTLDLLINQYGLPRFCKIDVENFEYEVLSGLSYKIPYLSFEFAIEMIHNTEKCITYLAKLGYNQFNFAIAENNKLELDSWVSSDEIINKIRSTNSYPKHDLWGDIYAKYE